METLKITDPPIDRREFMARCTRAGVSVAAASAVSLGFYRSEAPEGFSESSASVEIPDFSIAEMPPRICIARGTDRAVAVRQAFAALGGMQAFVRPGERVLLKVNAAFASSPGLGATALCPRGGPLKGRSDQNNPLM